MRRLLALVAGCGLLWAMASAPVGATQISASISPSTQTHAHNVASSWTGSWTGNTPFHVEFWYGDGFVTTTDLTNSHSKAYTHVFAPCPGEATTYTQTLNVWDSWPGPGYFTYKNSVSHEAAGSPC